MTLPEQVKEAYDAISGPGAFRDDLEALLLNPTACVWSSHELFVAARRVYSRDHYEVIVDPHAQAKTKDCWHVHMLAGCIQKAFTLAPVELSYVSYESRHRLVILPFNRFRRLADAIQQPIFPARHQTL